MNKMFTMLYECVCIKEAVRDMRRTRVGASDFWVTTHLSIASPCSTTIHHQTPHQRQRQSQPRTQAIDPNPTIAPIQ